MRQHRWFGFALGSLFGPTLCLGAACAIEGQAWGAIALMGLCAGLIWSCATFDEMRGGAA